MLRTNAAIVTAICMLAGGSPRANEEFVFDLHQRVQWVDTIVIARVLAPERALLSVERVIKGHAPKQITLTAYIDGFLPPTGRRPLVQDARELIFMNKQGDAYAPLQTQDGRWSVKGDRIAGPFDEPWPSLSTVIGSIKRLVTLQARAARSDEEADRALVSAFRDSDPEVQDWALDTASQRIKVPSTALADALLARWPKDGGDVANAMLVWRLRRAAPIFAKTLTESADGDERAWAAMALGGTGDSSYLDLLRQAAATDTYPQTRAFAYEGIMWMIGPDSLADLRRGAKDADEKVRVQAVGSAYIMLELDEPQRRWPSPSAALIAEVQAFLTEMRDDPARIVRDNAQRLLFEIAKHRP
jgi:HEAT repeats